MYCQTLPSILQIVLSCNGELLKGDTNLTSYLYNGKYGVMTDENGLYYMRHRYYNTDIRRFVNQDIVKGNLGNSQSLNRYSYVQGNPLTYTDPFGLSPEKDGGSIGMNIVHGLLDALGCVPGGVGIVANFANAALYAVVDHDYGMAALSLVAGVTLGASKIVSMGGKLAGHAKSIETIGRLVSNTASFAICAEQTVSSSAAMWNKYHEKGAKLSGETALEILGIGLNVAGMAASGKGIVESGNRLGKMVKEGGTTNKMSKGISESGTGTKDIYRAVSPEEFDDIFATGGFRARPDGRSFQAKEFGNSFDETLEFANKPINLDKAAIVKVTIPENVYNQLHHMNLDRAIFKSGTPVVEPEMLDMFNESIISIEHAF